MRAIKKGIAALLCAAMVITLAPAGNAGAAKKPKLNKKNVSVGVGETVKIKVKNAKKKAKVTWKTSKKAVAKITKKVSKGKKASATVMGVKVGKAKITAVYKLGKSKKKLNCTVTVHSTSIQQPQASAGAVVLPSNAPVVSGTPEVSTPPVVEGTPTARPKRSPTPEPTPTPTPLPDPGVEFEVPSNGYAIDVASFNCTAGSGKYDSQLKRVEVNDNDPSGGSQGNWELPANISANLKDGDLVTFRVQGYNYGDSGFRFWVGNPNSGGCTPIMLVDEVAEGLGVDPALGYPCAKDADGNVMVNMGGEDVNAQAAVIANQMAINADPETHAFDVTFTFKLATSQNDTNSAYTHFVLKHIMTGGTAGYINGLAIKNIYYITDEEIPPTPTMDPDQKGIDLSGTKAVYGDGSVSYDEASGSVTGTSVQGLLIPLEETLAEGESRKVTVYGEATGKVRLWLSDNDTHRLSDIVDPMTWANTYTLTATATGDGGTASNAIQIKVPYSDPATHVDITVTKVVVESVGDEPTPSKAPEATPSVKPDPTPSKEPEPTPSEEVTPSEGPTPTEEVGPTQTPTDEPAPSEGPEPTPSEEVTPSEAPTVYEVDLSVEKPYKQKDDSVTVEYSEGALNVTIPQFTGISFEVPADMVCKYAEVTYTSDSDIQTTMFDGDYAGSCDRGKPGEHDSGNPTLSKADVENTVKLEVREDFKGNCLKAIKIAHIDFGNSAPKSIKIKSIKFFSDNAEIGPTPSEGPEIPEGYVKVDLSTLKTDKDGSGATGKYDEATGQVTINDTITDISYGFTLPESVKIGDKVAIKVQGTYTGEKAFRVWIANGFYNNGSNTTQTITYSKGKFDVEVEVTITRDDCDTVMVKSISGQAIDGVIIDSIYLKNITPEDPYAPVKVDLSKMTCDADYAQYDAESGLIKVNDNRTGDGDSSTMYIPIPVTVVPGQTVKVTISGPKWGDNDFRIWTTPVDGTTSGDFVENNGIYLNPTKNDDGSFTKTVELVAKGKNCDHITLKPAYGTKIKGLEISEITVQLVEYVAPDPTPTPTKDPNAPEWDGVVELSEANVAWTDYQTDGKFEDGVLSLNLNCIYGGYGIGLYIKNDHSKVDLSLYSKVVIEYEAEDAYPMCFELRNGDNIKNDYWNPGATNLDGKSVYDNLKKGLNTWSIDLVDKLAANKESLGNVPCIFIKYNPGNEESDWVKNEIRAKVKIKSIKFE